MRREASLLPLGVLLVLCASTRARAEDAPLQSLPYTPGLDPTAMDRATDPCVDFYQYSCGGWMKRNPIPPDEPRWDVYGRLAQDNERFMWGILRDLGDASRKRTPDQQKVGDFFASCMDEGAAERRGAQPLQAQLGAIAALTSRTQLPVLLARLHRWLGVGYFFTFFSSPDPADSSSVIGFASAGGLGLPDRDYYAKTDPRSVTLRKQYVEHVQRMFRLLGDAPTLAKREAAAVLSIETELALATLTRVELRDPYKTFHKVDLAGLRALTPRFDWSAYFREAGLAPQPSYNVTQPAFYRTLDKILATRPVEALRSYLRWHVVLVAASHLSKDFVTTSFDFFQKTLQGVPEQPPRWKRCVGLSSTLLRDALAQEFVARTFGPALKASAQKMTEQIERAMERALDGLTWMSAPTRQRAREKLRAIVNKIGYPDKWLDYATLSIASDDFVGNIERVELFELRRDLAKIGRPLDRAEWSMAASEVNAGYTPELNDITFPAGVLQPPLYDPKMDDAPNYGNTGSTIGHELTHGFDDEGRQYDARGNLADWWTSADAQAFEARAQCIVDQYAQYTIVDDLKINSKLTEGEDIADLGGLVLAWAAWRAEPAGRRSAPRDGLSPEQRFFVGYAQWACENVRPEDMRAKAVIDPHSPARYRVNGLVANMPEFEQAFSCKPGQPMAPVKRCRVW